MSGGRLRIEGDTSQAIRSLGELEAKGTSVAASIGKSFQLATRMAGAGFKSLRQEVLREGAAVARGEEEQMRASERRRKRVRQSVSEDTHAQGNAYRVAGKVQEDVEEKATKAAEREAEKRKRVTERETAKKLRLIERAEKEATRLAAKENKQREKDQEKSLGTAKRTISSLVGAGVSVAGGLHNELQAARRTRAAPERELNLALAQTGANRSEAQARFRRMTQFAASNGMTSDELAGAANAVQTEFASLGDRSMSSADRGKSFETFLERAKQGRNLGVNVGEYTRFAGMLDSLKMGDDMKKSILSYGVGASWKGSVELGNVTKDAMSAMQGRIQLAMATSEKNGMTKPQAMDKAIRQTYAELQIAKGLGIGPRQAGNVMLALDTALQNDTQNEKMANNLQVKFGKGNTYQKELFNVGKGGKRVLKNEYRDALSLSQKLSSMGMSPTDISNVFGPGGHGNPQSLQANWRKLMDGLAGVDGEGVTYGQRVKELMDPSSAATAEDEKRIGDIMANDSQSQLNRDDENRLNATNENTSWLQKLSNSFAEFAANHPIAAAVAGAALPGLMNAAGGPLASKAASKLAELGGGGGAGLVKSGTGVLASLTAGLLIGDQLTKVLGKNTNAEGNRESIFNANTWKVGAKWLTGDEADNNKSVYQQRADTGFQAMNFARQHSKEFAALDPSKQAEAAKIMSRIGLDKDTMEQLAHLIGASIAANPPVIAPATVEQARSASAGRTPNTAVQ